MIPNLEVLGSLVTRLHEMFSSLFFVFLPVGMLLSVVIGFFKSGDAGVPDVVKRAFVASLLLVSFPEISSLILDVCDGLAQKIDDMSGLNAIIQMANEKARTYTLAKNALLLKFDDLFISILSLGSFMLLYFARYITVALYYFFWVLISTLSPLMILAYIFPSTAHITRNLYRGLIEVASWKIMWAVLSAMLTSLSFGDIYQTEGAYITLIVMNFVISIALLFTPLLVRSLVSEGMQSSAQSIGTATLLAMLTLPKRVQAVKGLAAQALRPEPKSPAVKPFHQPKSRR